MTPQDYQPPGFKEAESDTFVFEKEPVKLSMGEVVTPYHSLKLGMATERHRLEQVNGCPPVLVYSTTDGQEMEEEMKRKSPLETRAVFAVVFVSLRWRSAST